MTDIHHLFSRLSTISYPDMMKEVKGGIEGLAFLKTTSMKFFTIILVQLLFLGCKKEEEKVFSFCLESNQSPAINCKEGLCPPILLEPANCTIFDIYPREVNYKWTSNSTLDSIEYEWLLEISSDFHIEKGGWEEKVWGANSQIVKDTFRNTGFPGAQPGRWKVRSIHEKDTSDWSAWFYIKYLK